eukprot:scaffold3108_cov74-Phaeocystis_antarctica.AAC.2
MRASSRRPGRLPLRPAPRRREHERARDPPRARHARGLPRHEARRAVVAQLRLRDRREHGRPGHGDAQRHGPRRRAPLRRRRGPRQLAQGAPPRQPARPLGDAQHRRRRRVHRRGGREGLGAQRPAAPPPAPPLGSGEATPRGEKAGRPSGSGSARQRAAAPRRRPLRGPAATPPRRARRGADGATTGTAAGMRGADGAREARGIEDGGADGQRHRSEAPPQQKNTGCVDRGRSVRRASTATKKKGRAVLRPRQHPTGGAPPQAAPQL